MKVLVVAPSLHTRGGITSVVRLHMETKAWTEMNCEHLPTHEDGSTARKLWTAISSYIKAPLKVAEADIVHIHMAGEHSLLRKLPIAMLARLFRKPYIAHIHASGPESLFERTPRWATQTTLAHAARVIALSNSWTNVIQTHVPESKVEVIPNPVRISPARVSDGNQTVLFAGKLEARKGYKTLLRAIPTILARYPHTKFVFAGHGEVDAATRLAAELGICASVQMLGWVGHSQMNRLYSGAAVFCLPSRNEGVPMSVLEAMSHGVPVVCTPVGGLPEIIVDRQNGMLAAVDDAESVGAGILSLLNDSQYAAAVGEAGRATVYGLCGIDSVDKSLSLLYNEIASERFRSRAEVEQLS
jgi:glycosyltransferase involved in cell wall biosynthesis